MIEAPVARQRSRDRFAASHAAVRQGLESKIADGFTLLFALFGRKGNNMASLLECNARAALCRRLAKLDPSSKDIWLAEAERWSRLAQAKLLAQASDGPDAQSAHTIPISADRDCD